VLPVGTRYPTHRSALGLAPRVNLRDHQRRKAPADRPSDQARGRSVARWPRAPKP